MNALTTEEFAAKAREGADACGELLMVLSTLARVVLDDAPSDGRIAQALDLQIVCAEEIVVGLRELRAGVGGEP